MNYLSLDKYRYAWFYQHQEMPVPQDALDLIQPMTPQRSQTLWNTFISLHADHPESFTGKDWASHGKQWEEGDLPWQAAWDSSDPSLPEGIDAYIPWDDQTVVYFCYQSEHVVETRWSVFKAHWKNFLFLDDGPILIGKKRKEVVQFQQNGRYRLGTRPSNTDALG